MKPIKLRKSMHLIYEDIDGIESELKQLRKSAKKENDHSKVIAYDYCINKLAGVLKKYVNLSKPFT